MTKRISVVLGAAAFAVLAACGSAPTGPSAVPGESQSNISQTDSAGRVPNLFGSGN